VGDQNYIPCQTLPHIICFLLNGSLAGTGAPCGEAVGTGDFPGDAEGVVASSGDKAGTSASCRGSGHWAWVFLLRTRCLTIDGFEY